MNKQELEISRGHKVSNRYYELFEKISNISNSEFPLVDFLNDIEAREYYQDKTMFIDRAYDDIEKIYETFIYYYNKSKEN